MGHEKHPAPDEQRTGGEVTDEEIRELRESVGDAALSGDPMLRNDIRKALGEASWWGEYPCREVREVARARCAAIIAARKAGRP